MTKKRKSNAGRPTKITEEVVKKLEYILERDGTISMACTYAGISRETYYNRLEKDSKFSDRMERAKNSLYILALDGLHANIKNKDKLSIESFLKRRDKRYRDKQEQEVDATIQLVRSDE